MSGEQQPTKENPNEEPTKKELSKEEFAKELAKELAKKKPGQWTYPGFKRIMKLMEQYPGMDQDFIRATCPIKKKAKTDE